MKRRDFLKFTSAIPLPLLLNGLPLEATAASPLLKLLGEQSLSNGKVLVLIQMSGGNDGLNTVIPLDQYSQIANARSNIMIPSNKVLPLNGLPQTGFHPSMPELQNLYNNGQMNIVQGVSYDNPNFSHFRASDIWLTGSAANITLATGWLGRAQETSFPGFPVGYPVDHPEMPDPLAIQIGLQASIVTQASSINTAFTVTDPSSFYNLVTGQVDAAPANAYGHELTFLRLIKTQTNAYADVITKAFSAANTMATYPDNNSLADQLKIVARLIKGGLKTPVYVVNHPISFDTHSSQVDGNDTTKGFHSVLLTMLSQAVGAFQQDLVAMKVDNRVAAMTFTEFGRRIKSNDSGGTDHGVGNPVFFFGSGVNPVMIGTNPVLPAYATVNDQVPMQYDFRAVYYSVLQEWFEMTDDQLQQVLFQPYTTLPIFKTSVALPVKLLSFTGKWLSNKVVLQWDVDQESDIDAYEVQRSDDAAAFTKIGTVSAVNSQVKYTYNFDDLNLSKSLYYYRIKIVEKSGSTRYSSVILLKSNQTVTGVRVKIYPNPVTDQFTVSLENKLTGTVTVQITDLGGKEVWKQEKQVTDAFNINFSFADKKPVRGIYAIYLYAKNAATNAKIFIQ